MNADLPPHPPCDLFLTREQVRRVDHLAINTYGVPGIVLMENAGRGAAEIIRAEILHRTCLGEQPAAAIACGPGNNGGDGLVIARHLSNAGWSVTILLAGSPARVAGDAAINLRIIERMGLPIHVAEDAAAAARIAVELFARADVIVDALLGTGATGPPRLPAAAVIEAINAAAAARAGDRPVIVVAVDLPSGLDADSGQPAEPSVRADHTITFVARKTGYRSAAAAAHLGQVHVVDIGAPARAIHDALTAAAGSG